MEIFLSLYNEILWRPLFNLLVWLYTVLPWQDIGLAIIVLTIIIRIVLLPLLIKSQRAQREMALIQPEIKRIQEQYKDDREGQARAMMELYKTHNINPFSGCMVLLIQLPIFIALFQVFQQGFHPENLTFLYSFVINPEHIDAISFGILDLSKGNMYLGVLAALSQYFQTKMVTPPPHPAPPSQKPDFSRIMQTQMLYVFPFIILIFSFTLPAALVLYWTVLNIFGILQEIFMKRIKAKG